MAVQARSSAVRESRVYGIGDLREMLMDLYVERQPFPSESEWKLADNAKCLLQARLAD